MKIKLVVLLLVLFGLSACSQYTCPTYAKKDVKKESKEQPQSERM